MVVVDGYKKFAWYFKKRCLNNISIILYILFNICFDNISLFYKVFYIENAD